MNFSFSLNTQNHFSIIKNIADELNQQVYIVGGFVRDLILERERNEVDFLVIGDGPTFAQKLA
ncbi:MAG: tRNA nucleotidyltransferase, partial [Ignavibacteriae bacterium]|nr:tRNA nucleotidyltransferase [Ignavibacteriota bacterium]